MDADILEFGRGYFEEWVYDGQVCVTEILRFALDDKSDGVKGT